jgi:hypothetical protein
MNIQIALRNVQLQNYSTLHRKECCIKKVKFFLCLIKRLTMNIYVESEGIIKHDNRWSEWSASHPGRLSPGESAPLFIVQEVWWSPDIVWISLVCLVVYSLH